MCVVVAWIFTNIAVGTAEHTACVIRHGAVPILITLLESKSDVVKEQAGSFHILNFLYLFLFQSVAGPLNSHSMGSR